MSAGVGAFLFGLLAGYLMLRLGRLETLGDRERKILVPLGCVLMGASLTLAAGLFGWAALGGRNL